VTLADISVLRTSSPFDHRCPLDWLPTSRLLPPRSGLERSDLVLWHVRDMPTGTEYVRQGKTGSDRPAVKTALLTHGSDQHLRSVARHFSLAARSQSARL